MVALRSRASWPAQRAGQYAVSAEEHVDKLDAAFAQVHFADLVGVTHAAGFDHIERSISFTGGFNLEKVNPGVDHGRDFEVRRFAVIVVDGDVGEYAGDAFALEVVDEPDEQRMHFIGGACPPEITQGIDGNNFGIERVNITEHGDEMGFESRVAGSAGVNFEQALVDARAEIDSNRVHVAHDLVGGFLEGKENAPFAALTCGFHETRGYGRFARARRAGYER